MVAVICSYKTSSDNTFFDGNASDSSGTGPIRLDTELLVVEMMAAPAASEMPVIRLSALGMAAEGMSARLASQAVLQAPEAAKQV